MSMIVVTHQSDRLEVIVCTCRIYMPCLYVLNKIDGISLEELELLDKCPHYVPISAAKEWNFDELLEKIWDYCCMIRMCVRARVCVYVCVCRRCICWLLACLS